jgi:hypothetical protein
VALEPRKFFLDVQARQFVSSPDSTLPSSEPAWINEDVESIQLYALRPTLNANQPYEYVDISAATVKFAVGTTTPAALQTAWTALSTTVTTTVSTLVTGGSGTAEQQKLAFSGAIPAQGGFAIQLPSRSVTVSSVAAGVFTAAAHGLCNGQQVTLSAFTISGGTFANAAYFVADTTDSTFRIATSANAETIAAAVTSGGGTATIGPVTTGQIPYSATAADIQAAFVAAGINVDGAAQITVTGTPRTEFIFVYGGRMSGRDYAEFSVVGSTLAGAKGVGANVSYNTAEIAALIAAGTTAVTMEIEIAEGAVRQTFRRAATLSDDLITSTSPAPIPSSVITSFDIQSQDGSVWTVTMTNSGELEWTKQ